MATANNTLLHRYLPLLIVAATSLVIALIGEDAKLALRFDRHAIADHQWWRVLTGNLAHLSWNHLWMNLAGLAMIYFIYERQLTHRLWWLNFLVCSLAVGIGLLLLNPQLNWYVGLSGTLHGLLLTGIVINIAKKEKLDYLLFVLVTGKLLWEHYAGALPGSAETAGGPVIVDAHLYGAIAGGVMGVVYAFFLGRKDR